MACNSTWETYPASEYPNKYVGPIMCTAVSRKVDQNKFSYATMPKGSVGHIPYIFIKNLEPGVQEVSPPLRYYDFVLTTPYRPLSIIPFGTFAYAFILITGTTFLETAV